MSHASAPAGPHRMARASVWICEYPYRTMRLSGPSSDCAGCPVWQNLQAARARTARAKEEVRFLETLVAS